MNNNGTKGVIFERNDKIESLGDAERNNIDLQCLHFAGKDLTNVLIIFMIIFFISLCIASLMV